MTDEDGEEIEVINLEGGRYSFEMPDGKVSVDATFMEDNTISSDVLPVCRILSKRHCAMQLHGFWTA